MTYLDWEVLDFKENINCLSDDNRDLITSLQLNLFPFYSLAGVASDLNLESLLNIEKHPYMLIIRAFFFHL